MNQDIDRNTVRVAAPDSLLRVSATGADAFGHLHFDRATRSWWAHDETPIQLDPAPAGAAFPISRCA